MHPTMPWWRWAVSIALPLALASAGPAASRTPSDIGSFTDDMIRREVALRQQELDLFRQRLELQNQLSRGFQARGLDFQPAPLNLSPWGSSAPFLDALRGLASTVPGGLSSFTPREITRLLDRERQLIEANRRAIESIQDSTAPALSSDPAFSVQSSANAVNDNRNNNQLRKDPQSSLSNRASSDLDSRFDLTGTNAFAPSSTASAPPLNQGAFDPGDPFGTLAAQRARAGRIPSGGSTTLAQAAPTPSSSLQEALSRPLNDIGTINEADRKKMQMFGHPLTTTLRDQPSNLDPAAFDDTSAAQTAAQLQLGAGPDGVYGTADDFPVRGGIQTGAPTRTQSQGTENLIGNVNNQADARSSVQTNFGTGTSPGPTFPRSTSVSRDARGQTGISGAVPTSGTFPPGNAPGLQGRFDGQVPPGSAFGLRQGLHNQAAPGTANFGTGTNFGNTGSSRFDGTSPGSPGTGM